MISMSSAVGEEWLVGVDVGGTFTDFMAFEVGTGRIHADKCLSTPDDPSRAILASLVNFIHADGKTIGRFAHGTTVGTNALVERRLGKVGMVTTRGFRDLLEIGRQTRPKIYNIHEDHPEPLVTRELRLEVSERIRADGTVLLPLDEEEMAPLAETLKKAGVSAVLVGFLHSHAFPQHERRAAARLRELLGPGVDVIASSDVYPEFREYERFSTAALNATLMTVMQTYLSRLQRGIATAGVDTEPLVSQSAGALMSIDMAIRLPIRTALSGPAAGVRGALARARVAQMSRFITLDVGGTTADVCLVDGEPPLVNHGALGGFPLRMPVLDINSVGAGGGSIAWIDRDGLMKVGPQSAGARPGPAAYGLGGTAATVTDAQLVLGRLAPNTLLGGHLRLDLHRARTAVAEIADSLCLSLEETAAGIIDLVCSNMVGAIRAVSFERGYDPAEFALLAFGGAGPLHATEVARELGMAEIVVPARPGLLCAEGLLNSNLSTDLIRAVRAPLAGGGNVAMHAVDGLTSDAMRWFEEESVPEGRQLWRWAADLRYAGQSFEITIRLEDPRAALTEVTALAATFHDRHETAYGYSQQGEPIELVALRLTLAAQLDGPAAQVMAEAVPSAPEGSRPVWLAGGWLPAPVYQRDALARDQQIPGPAIIDQLDSTIVVHPGDRASVLPTGDIVIGIAVR